jgi:hypothetical protein
LRWTVSSSPFAISRMLGSRSRIRRGVKSRIALRARKPRLILQRGGNVGIASDQRGRPEQIDQLRRTVVDRAVMRIRIGAEFRIPGIEIDRTLFDAHVNIPRFPPRGGQFSKRDAIACARFYRLFPFRDAQQSCCMQVPSPYFDRTVVATERSRRAETVDNCLQRDL